MRLAPLYDVSSVAPYPDRYDLPRTAMAMSINGTYQNSLVTGEDWRAFAVTVGVEPDEMTGWVHDVTSNAADALADAVREEADWIGDLDMTAGLIDGVAANARRLLRFLDPPGAATAQLDLARAIKPHKPRVEPYRKADGTWVSGYPNPRYRG